MLRVGLRLQVWIAGPAGQMADGRLEVSTCSELGRVAIPTSRPEILTPSYLHWLLTRAIELPSILATLLAVVEGSLQRHEVARVSGDD